MKRRIILHVLFSLALVATILGRAPQATGAQTVASGTVQAWGDNGSGQLGNGTMTRTECACIPTPVSVSGLSGVTALASGDYHSLALLSDGTMRAWGYNYYGQLGTGTAPTGGCACIHTPVPVINLSGVTAIAAGGVHSLALLGDGTIRSWGENSQGQLGVGTTTNSATPVPVSGLGGVTAIAGTTSAWRSWATAPSVTGASTATASWAPVRRAPISERRYRSPV